MIGEILPAGVVAHEAYTDVDEPMLYHAERALLVRAVAKRRREFATVRVLARRAMADLGIPPAAVIPGPRGAPGWPPGVVGSMTHCDGYRASALARTQTLASIGIDAEPHAPLPDDVRDLIARPEEQALLAGLGAAMSRVHWDRLLFSAKESVYKAWYPLAGRWLDFTDASLTLTDHAILTHSDPDTAQGTFIARLLVDGPRLAGEPLNTLTGRWRVANGLVVTTVTVPTRESDSRH